MADTPLGMAGTRGLGYVHVATLTDYPEPAGAGSVLVTQLQRNKSSSANRQRVGPGIWKRMARTVGRATRSPTATATAANAARS